MSQTSAKILFLALLGLLGSASTASAAEIELTPFWGYTWGGDFDDVPAIDKIKIGDDDSYGVTLGFMTSDVTQLELLWSHQETDLEIRPIIGPVSTLGLNVDQYHIGGLYLPDTGSDQVSPFVSFSLGFTVFDPAGLGSNDKFSFSLGGGVKYFLGERMGLRLQLRWSPTYVNSTSEGIFCDPFGFCYEIQDAHYVNQVEASAGLIIKF
jgi:opacity protein-like surface antigen